jgi:hypothetical protein
MAVIRSDQAAQLISVNAGISQNACQCAALEFTMQRHDERCWVLWVSEPYVAATLAH